MAKKKSLSPLETVDAEMQLAREVRNITARLRRDEWMGKAAQFPEVQTDLATLFQNAQDTMTAIEDLKVVYEEEKTQQDALKKLGKPQSAAYIAGKPAIDATLKQIREEKIAPGLQKVAGLFSRLTSGLGKISFDIAARYQAQIEHNNDLESWKGGETPAPQTMIDESRKGLLPGRDFFDTVDDMLKGRQTPEHAQDEDIKTGGVIDWYINARKQDPLKSLDAPLRDIKGFNEAAVETGLPIESKLGVMEMIVYEAGKQSSLMQDYFSKRSAAATGRRSDFGPAG